jgi:hypothetical protein
MKKVFAVLAISTLVAFTSCKKAEDATNTTADSTVKSEVTAPAPEAAPADTSKDAAAAPADTAKKVEEVKH